MPIIDDEQISRAIAPQVTGAIELSIHGEISVAELPIAEVFPAPPS